MHHARRFWNFTPSNWAPITLLNCPRNARNLLRSSVQSRSSSRRTTRRWENATGRSRRFAAEKVQRSVGPSMRRPAAPSKDGNQIIWTCLWRYVEKLPGQFLADTQCEKLPVEICGAGCVFEEGPEKCHDKVFISFFREKTIMMQIFIFPIV